MAEVPKWVRENMKKAGASAPSSMHSKLKGGTATLHSKIAAPTHPMGGCVHDKPKAKPVKQIPRFADGGEVDEEALKKRGLDLSKDEKVGFFERIKMGNIDDPRSEAYNRFGAGRAKTEDAGRAATGDKTYFAGKTTESSNKESAKAEAVPEPKMEVRDDMGVEGRKVGIASGWKAQAPAAPSAVEGKIATPKKAAPKPAAPAKDKPEPAANNATSNYSPPRKPVAKDEAKPAAAPAKAADAPKDEQPKRSTYYVKAPGIERNAAGGIKGFKMDEYTFQMPRTAMDEGVPWSSPRTGRDIKDWAAALKSGKKEVKPAPAKAATRAEQMKKYRGETK